MYENIKSYDDIKKNFTPVCYKLKHYINNFLIDEFDPNEPIYIDGNDYNDVSQVIWCKKGYKNIVTYICNENLKKDIESKDFRIDEEYITNLLIKKTKFNTKEDVSRYLTFGISLQEDNITQNIQIIYNFYFKITDSFEYKIPEYAVKGGDLLTPLNNSPNIHVVPDDINETFYQEEKQNYIIKDESKVYILLSNNEKYYIISKKTHKEDELIYFLTKKIEISKEMIFDTNQAINFESESVNVIPGEYKIIYKENEKKYNFFGDKNLSDCIKKPINVSSGTKVKVKSLFKDQDTNKYIYIAKNKITNNEFTNDQEIEPGSYELIRKDKPKDINKGGSGHRAYFNGKETTGPKCKCCCQ